MIPDNEKQFTEYIIKLAQERKEKGIALYEIASIRKIYGVGKKTARKIADTTLFSYGTSYFFNEKCTLQGKIVARNSHNEKYSHVIYRFVDINGKVIYIGRAKHLENRLNSHGHLPKECYREIESIHYTKFSTEDDLDIAEPYYISRFKPKYNKDFKSKRYSFKIDFLENKKWKNYDTFKIL